MKSNKKQVSYSCIRTILIVVMTLFANLCAYAEDDDFHEQAEPIELLVNFQVSGHFAGFTDQGIPFYTLGGPGYAPDEIFSNGVISDTIETERQVATLEGAKIVFTGAPTDPVVRFSCLPSSCTMRFKDGSVLESNAGVGLEGRAVNMWGPVVNSPQFDPANGIYPIRILGCGGLKETSGNGRLANMVGSICFNGVLNFNQNDQSVLTGSSKCTLTLHTPIDPSTIP